MYPNTPNAWGENRAGIPAHQRPYGQPPTPPQWGGPPAGGYGVAFSGQPQSMPYPAGTPWAPPSWPATPATPPPAQRRGRRWGAAVAGVAVLGAVASAIVWWPLGTGQSGSPNASATAPVAAVPVSTMDELLLTRAEAGKIFGTGPLGPRGERSDRVYTQMTAHQATVDDDCNVGVPAAANEHEGSGWQAVRRQFLATQDDPTPQDNQSLIQAIVNFPDAATARQFVDTSKVAWQRCVNRSMNLKVAADASAPNDYWNSSEFSDAGGGIGMTFTQEGADGWSCRDSMASVDNIVIELELCGLSPSKPVDEVVAQITAKIEAST
jgi:serine/threonine kinase PknH